MEYKSPGSFRADYQGGGELERVRGAQGMYAQAQDQEDVESRFLIKANQITAADAARRLRLVLAQGGFLPPKDCEERLRKWEG